MEPLRLPQNPSELLPEIQTRLADAVTKFAHPWRTPTLATVANGFPKMRTVVLRDLDFESRQFVCHTDRRSAKVEQIAANPNIAWHFYDPDSKIQLQFTGTAVLRYDGELFERIWQQASPSQRLMYLAPYAPGTSRDSAKPNLPNDVRIDELDIATTEPGEQNFCVVDSTFDQMEWLLLHPTGNQRAKFIWNEQGLTAEWIAA